MSRRTRVNKLTSPELISQVLPENRELQAEFLEYLKNINRSPNTIAGYENDLDILFVWNLQHNKNKLFRDITKRDFIRYQGWLINENENSSSRVRRLRSAISSLSNYVENIIADEDEDYEGFRSIVRKIEAPPLERTREKTVWSEEEVKSLLDKLMEMQEYEKACYLALAAYSGRRKSELFRYKVEYFDDENLIAEGKLYFTPKIKTKGRGKEGKMLNTYVIAESFKPYFDAWLEWRNANDIESEWLFPEPGNPEKHRQSSAANSWANTFSRISGMPVYMHSLRNFFCTYLLKLNIPESVVVEMFGWSSADMLKIYDDRSSSELVENSIANLASL